MESNPERRDRTRFLHESKITLENSEIGVQRGCMMYNFNYNGLYIEADARLEQKAEIRIGINNSPFASEPDKFESYRAIIKWRKTLKRSSYYYGYGVEFIFEDAVDELSKLGEEVGVVIRLQHEDIFNKMHRI